MIDTALLERLREIVGPEHVGKSRADAEVYGYDASLAQGVPEAVVLPADTGQTAAVVRAAAAAGVPLVPRGFGTNLSGGSVALRGGLIVGLSRLTRVLAIDVPGRYAVVQSGATNLELQNALAPHGFYFAPDPASQKVSTLGGNVAENSGGPHCLKYGVTANHVLGMTAVLPDGEVVRVGGPALDPPGCDLRGLLIGSEGTLAIITELVVRILPSPEAVVTLLAVYDDVAEAAQSVSDIIAAGILPATLEMMDATVIRAVEASKPCGYPLDAAAVLIAEVDGPAVGLAAQAERIRELCADNRCREVRRAKDAAERDRLWAGRRGAFGAIARLAPNYLVADCTVPRTRLPNALGQVAAIAEKHQLSHGNVFHAGDGNLHPLLLFDSRDADQVRRVHEAGREIVEACVALGGTITGEHGVGVEKIEAMRLIFSEDDLEVQRRVRGALDPRDLLNPGKIVPPAGKPRPSAEPAIGELARDQELLPADVDEACDMVRRAYLDGASLLLQGNGSQLDFGNSWSRSCIPLQTSRLSGDIEYDPANQVVTVESGMPFESLQDLLDENAQWLPLRPPRAVRHTIGGLAALGACGPERFRYGAPRDLLLGLKFISGEGRLIAAGGRVVKNVAGYDMTRLLAGSAGTLGLLTQLTFRVLSLPEQCVAVAATGSLDQCAAAAADLMQSKLDPALVAATRNRPDAGESAAGWRFAAGFEGFEETVAFQTENCRRLCEAAGLRSPELIEYAPRTGMFRQTFETLWQARFLVRVDLPPDRVAAMLTGPLDAVGEADLLADFGCGRIWASAPDLDDARWTAICLAARNAEGHAVAVRATDSFRREHDVFGPPREDWQLMHRIKEALDPRGVFAPGRMPGRK